MMINNRMFVYCRHYVRNKKGKLVNTPYVDNCYKWAGGGFLSTSEDLIKFGNAMLYASQVADYQGKAKDDLLRPGIDQKYFVKLEIFFQLSPLVGK